MYLPPTGTAKSNITKGVTQITENFFKILTNLTRRYN